MNKPRPHFSASDPKDMIVEKNSKKLKVITYYQ